MSLELKSSAFSQGETIPDKYTCQGEDISPPLKWKDAPNNTANFVLICDDPDAPSGTWDHWVLYNLSGQRSSLSTAIPTQDKIEEMAQGLNSWDKVGWGGPCPPPGKAHRYFFHLYALKKNLNLQPGLTKKEVLETIEDHIIEETVLMGRYKR